MEKILEEAKERKLRRQLCLKQGRRQENKKKKGSSWKRNDSEPKRRRLLHGRWRTKQEALRIVSKLRVSQKRRARSRGRCF